MCIHVECPCFSQNIRCSGLFCQQSWSYCTLVHPASLCLVLFCISQSVCVKQRSTNWLTDWLSALSCILEAGTDFFTFIFIYSLGWIASFLLVPSLYFISQDLYFTLHSFSLLSFLFVYGCWWPSLKKFSCSHHINQAWYLFNSFCMIISTPFLHFLLSCFMPFFLAILSYTTFFWQTLFNSIQPWILAILDTCLFLHNMRVNMREATSLDERSTKDMRGM